MSNAGQCVQAQQLKTTVRRAIPAPQPDQEPGGAFSRMIPALPQNATLEGAVHIVQQALTPVFLLSGIAALLNVFAARLGRVADQADMLSGQPEAPNRERRLTILRWRTRALDAAVVLAALGGICTSGTVLALFLGEVKGAAAASLLFLLFGGALILTMGSLGAFVVEMLMAAQGVRRLLDVSAGKAERR